jgi:hypothetical protein
MKEFYTKSEISVFLDEFYSLYNERPVKDNTGGMKASHMFAFWFLLKKINPEAVIESGVFKGNGTWLIEKACPNAKIACIDPCLYQRVYVSSKAVYTTTDFLLVDWSNLKDRNVLVFFDDHQDSIKRIRRCNELGFKKIIVEDNYPIDQGDCYSPKKALSNKNYLLNDTTCLKNTDDYKFLKENLEYYQESFPIFDDTTTVWNTPWKNDLYNTPESLLTEDYKNKYPVFFNERKDYYWLCYLQLK